MPVLITVVCTHEWNTCKFLTLFSCCSDTLYKFIIISGELELHLQKSDIAVVTLDEGHDVSFLQPHVFIWFESLAK